MIGVRVGRVCGFLAAVAIGFGAMATHAPPALAACAHGGEFARYVAPYARTIVVGRLESVEPTSTRSPPGIETYRGDVALIRVLDVFRGSAAETISVSADVLGDCTHSTNIGERILLAFVEDSPAGAYVGSWHEDRRGTWWHNFDSYSSLGALLRALDVPPDTSAVPAGPRDELAQPVLWFAVWVGLAVLFLRRPFAARRQVRLRDAGRRDGR